MTRRHILILATMLAVFHRNAFGQTPSTNNAPASGSTPEHSAKLLADPLSKVFYLSLQDRYSPVLWGASGGSNQILARARLPFELWGVPNITRITLPWTTGGPNGSGLNQSEVYDLIIYRTEHGGIGAGPGLLIPTVTSPTVGSKTWAAGPTVAGRYTFHHWQVSLLVRSYFSFAGPADAKKIDEVRFQPDITYLFGQGWSASVNANTLDYDFIEGKWSRVRLGVGVQQSLHTGPIKWSYSFEPLYDFINETNQPRIQIRFALFLLSISKDN